RPQRPAEVRHREVVGEYATGSPVLRADDPFHLLHHHAVALQAIGELAWCDEAREVMQSFRHGMVHVLLVPDHLQEGRDGAVVRQETQAAAGREQGGDSCQRPVELVIVLQDRYIKNYMEGYNRGYRL